MDINKLTRRIRIERRTVTTDPAYGTETVTWVTHAEPWAEVLDVLPSRSEQPGENITINSQPVRIRLRWRQGLTSDMRVILTDRANLELKIIGGPAEIGRRDGIELLCSSYTTSGGAT